MVKKTVTSPPLTRVYAWFSALITEDTALMEDLIVHGLPVDVPHPLRHTTALMEATRLGRTALVQWLLARGATPALLCGMPQGTPLHCALRRHDWATAELLIAASAQCGPIDCYGRTPLHSISMDMPEDGYEAAHALELASSLIDKGCPLDALDHEGITALHYCVINDCETLAHVLLAHGANPNALTPDTQVTPLTIAALEKNMALAQLLLAYGANLHQPIRDGSTPATIMPSLTRLAADAAPTLSAQPVFKDKDPSCAINE